jgi:hypothetical protein
MKKNSRQIQFKFIKYSSNTYQNCFWKKNEPKFHLLQILARRPIFLSRAALGPLTLIGSVRPKSTRDRRGRRAQATTWAWAGNSPPRALAPPGPFLIPARREPIWSVHFHPMAERSDREIKTSSRRLYPNPRFI